MKNEPKPRLKMTKEKVIILHKKKPDIINWTHEECRAVDDFVQRSAIRNLRKKLKLYHLPKTIYNYIVMMADFHYGSGETDDFLVKLKCYDEWYLDLQDTMNP